MNGIRCTPRQLYEASRLADRTGSAFMQELDGDRLLMLLTVHGQPEPDLALELDRDGAVVARQFLDLARRDADDDFSDLGDEEPLPPPLDVSHAWPAKRCECGVPIAQDGQCVVCGHALREDAHGAPEAA